MVPVVSYILVAHRVVPVPAVVTTPLEVLTLVPHRMEMVVPGLRVSMA